MSELLKKDGKVYKVDKGAETTSLEDAAAYTAFAVYEKACEYGNASLEEKNALEKKIEIFTKASQAINQTISTLKN